jgi:hypothetical protein
LHFRFRVGYTQNMDDAGVHEGFDWEEAEDFTVLSEGDLRETLEAHREEERLLGYRQRILQGRMDLIRAELASRGAATLPPEDLARVLLGELPGEESR